MHRDVAAATFIGALLDRSRGFSIFQYSLCATWNVTGLRLENGSFGTATSTGGLAAAAPESKRGKESERSAARLIYISRELSAFDISEGTIARGFQPPVGFEYPPISCRYLCDESVSTGPVRECNR